MNRKAAFSKEYYPDSFSDLDKTIKASFLLEKGAGSYPGTRTTQEIVGCIVPHDYYGVSARCMSWVYKAMGEAKACKTFIIIGSDHNKKAQSFSTNLFSDWETPFGIFKINKELGKQLLQQFPSLVNEFAPYQEEHSIEVQLPFLQFVNMDYLPEITFVPLMIQSLDYTQLSAFAKVLANFQDVCVIISTNFTHYGKEFGFVPFVFSKKENIQELDAKALEAIKQLDSLALLHLSKSTNICNIPGLIVLLEYCKLKNKKGQLLSYYTSGDMLGYKDKSVSYVGMTF